MKYKIFSDVTWVYPDTSLEPEVTTAALYTARGGDVCFQVLTDTMLDGSEEITYGCDIPHIVCEVYRLLPAFASYNSGAKSLTAKDYDEVKDFVTRKAPFEVYDITMPLDSREKHEGRLGLYIRLNAPAEAVPGVYSGSVKVCVGCETLVIPIDLTICGVDVPKLKDADFHMVNWITLGHLAADYEVEPYSEEFGKILYEYMKNQIDMRSDYLMIPAGEPIRDAEGRVVDFDFTKTEYVGRMAIYCGYNAIMGGFVADPKAFTDPEHMLVWDGEVGVTSIEGYRQLSIYFRRLWDVVVKNGWQDRWYQCLVDEPMKNNAPSYRALSAVCRKFMPGVKIHDPIETSEAAGALDVWVVKQAVYERELEAFRKLQEVGENIWIYTCGFPSGKTMNRVADLPLTVSRMTLWTCVMYGANGFLHWGYNYHTTPERNALCALRPKYGTYFMPGNSHVVYPGDGRPWYSVRGHAQRTGAQEAELLKMLYKRDRNKADELVGKIIKGFNDYDPSDEKFCKVRQELLETLEEIE